MAVRVIKSLHQTGQAKRKKARLIAQAIRAERGDSMVKPGAHVVITRRSTASGRGEITFRAAKVLVKVSRKGHGRKG
jgi:superfamily I DNA/RNA helicase